MASIDSPRQRLKDLREGLLRHHKALLESERAAYQHEQAPITSPGHFLNLLLTDPWFAWLREISALIVQIDERMDEKDPLTEAEAAAFYAQTRALLQPSPDARGFAKSYDDAMQRDVDVVLAHAEMMKVLQGKPKV